MKNTEYPKKQRNKFKNQIQKLKTGLQNGLRYHGGQYDGHIQIQ